MSRRNSSDAAELVIGLIVTVVAFLVGGIIGEAVNDAFLAGGIMGVAVVWGCCICGLAAFD